MTQHALQLVDETQTTTPPETVVEQLAADGYPITLSSGQTVRVRYSMLSLRRLEARFGSLVGISAELNTAQAAMKEAQEHDTVGMQGPIFTILSDAIACGLVDTRVVHPDTGRTIKLGDDSDLLMSQLDPSRLQEYLDAFARALAQAFGTLGKEIAASMQAATSSSLGGTGSTSAPSSPGAQMPSSGA